ncbi:MAG: hypothetical protein JWQ02_928 [Capsulimonas sp.]|nr:hypothetical protein [Capsulimonas sp.]
MEYEITETEGQLILRRTAPAAAKRNLQAVLRVLSGIVLLLVGGSPLVFTSYLTDGKQIVFDRKRNQLFVDGRYVCNLDKVALSGYDCLNWLPQRFHTRILVLRFPARSTWGNLIPRAIELKATKAVSQNNEITLLQDAISPLLPECVPQLFDEMGIPRIVKTPCGMKKAG